MNKPNTRPEELYNKEKILNFLQKNKEMLVTWTRITNNPDLKKRLESKQIRDFVVDVRHKLRELKEKEEKAKEEEEIKEEEKAKEEDGFELIYNQLSGDKKWINGFKSLVGYLLHMFDTENGEEKLMSKAAKEAIEVNKALGAILGIDTKEIFKAFKKGTNEGIESGLNPYEAQIKAYESIKKNYNKVQDIPEDQLLDVLIRRYNISRKI